MIFGRFPSGGTYTDLVAGATTPQYIATGTPDLVGFLANSPAYPATMAGDLLVATFCGRITSVSTLSGWTLIGGGTDQGGRKVYAYSRDARADGTETGTFTFSMTANSCIGACHAFRHVATSAFVEDVTQGGRNGNGSTVAGLQVDAGGAHRLAVILFGNGDQSNYDSLTGESGGNWIIRAEGVTGTGSDSGYCLQTADLDAGGTISGGSNTPTVAAPDSYASLAFALVGA